MYVCVHGRARHDIRLRSLFISKILIINSQRPGNQENIISSNFDLIKVLEHKFENLSWYGF